MATQNVPEQAGLAPVEPEPETGETGAASPPPKTSRARWIRRGLGLALGASAGFAYYSFVGCTSGGCPIWQDPFVSAGYGATIGFLALW